MAALVNAYPEYVNCGEELRLGQRWMGKDSEASTLAVQLEDAATNAPIACGATVATGTRVRAIIGNLDSGEQYVVEATGGVAQKMYAAQQAEGAAAGAEGAEAQPDEADQGDVVDAEFEEVKEDKRA